VSAPTVAVVHLPSGGHLRPLLPLVAALRERGARTVQWALPEWEEECRAVGGEFRTYADIDPDVDAEVESPPENPLAVAALIARITEQVAPALIEDLRAVGADVMLRDSFAAYGRYAADALSMPQVAFCAAMAFHEGIRPPLEVLPRALGQLVIGIPHALELRRTSRRLEDTYGTSMGSWLDVLGGRYRVTTLIGTSRELQIGPEALDGEDVHFVGPLRATDAPAPSDEPALRGLAPDAELVYVSLGTVFENRPAFFRDAARALARPGRHVVMSVGRTDPAQIGPLPAGVTAHARVDQLAVLRRAQLFVTHAGFNSLQESLAAGVPLLMHPQMAEQDFNARRATDLGAGLRLRRGSPREVAAKADRVLRDPAFRAAAAQLGAGLRAAADPAGAARVVLAAAGATATSAGSLSAWPTPASPTSASPSSPTPAAPSPTPPSPSAGA